MNIQINSETSSLKEVLIGNSYNFKSPLNFRDLYDPTSLINYLKGRYPIKFRLQNQLSKLKKTLIKNGVIVHELDIVNTNQIFSRDLGFVIDDKFFLSSIIPDREHELKGLKSILKNINNIVRLPKSAHIEGGDVVVDKNHVFIGYYGKNDYKNQITARTNKKAIRIIRDKLRDKEIFPIELIKSSTKPSINALHLDCCFQPVSKNKAVICKEAFANKIELNFLISYFGEQNIFEVTLKEMSRLYCNFFSINENTVITDKRFTRLIKWFNEIGMKVEKIDFSEISKLGGLFRCCTLPLIREKNKK
ncbi:MAG: dimethylarginine dimethylaminohydrolase family protein [Flavobacteriaceae bacterium]|tara:strand:+ start:1788 stop:2702 length:915 start_codon:yes stop_codon:yes gene_type:complete